MGRGIINIGVGTLISGILRYFFFGSGYVVTVVFYVFAFIIIHRAQKKYNGGWF